MSDIKRYTVDMKLREFELMPGLKATEDGEVVLYEDHLAALEAVKGKAKSEPLEGEIINTLLQFRADAERRIEALEENPLENHMVLVGEPKAPFMHKPVGELLQALVGPLKKRIEGLEKALNEHMVKERCGDVDQREYISRLGVIQDAGYSIIIDPKASPKDIPFEVALAYLKAGRRITNPRGESFRAGTYLVMFNNKIQDERGFEWLHPSYAEVCAFTNNDLLATDWMVIPEKQ